VNHAGRTLALVESSLPYEITNELETVGAYDFDGELADSMTAHPKICPATGELHFFGYGNISAPHVSYYRADAEGKLIVKQPIDVPGLTMMHDFALTAEHVVFFDLPVVFDVASLGQGMPYHWDANYGARLGVLRRDDLHTASATQHVFAPGHIPGEAVFAPGGWLLTYVYDATSDRSDLVVLDAENLAAPPVATVHLPQRVPAGFHGNWLPDA